MPKRSYSRPDDIWSGTSYTRSNSRSACGALYQEQGSWWVSRNRGQYSGASTPNFHQRQKRGEFLPLNPYVRWDYWAIRNPGTAVVSHQTPWCSSNVQTHTHNGVAPGTLMSVNGDYVSNIPDFGPVDYDALLVQAIADCLPSLDAGTTLAEAHKTVDMVLNVRKDAKHLISTALRGGKHTAKAAADAWMAWRYGWQQLGYDIKNVAEAVQTPFRPTIVNGRAGSSYKDSSTTVDNLDWDYSWVRAGNKAKVSLTTTVYVDVSRRANAYVRCNHRTINAMIDIPITAWELVPYSFVADWFVNIGDILKAWRVLRTYEILATSIGSKENITVQRDWLMSGVEGPDMVSASGAAGLTEIYTGRSRNHGWVPSLVPSVTVDLNSKRIADAAAMLVKRIL